MADIASALNNLSRAILKSITYNEAETIESFTVTPGVTQGSVSKEMSQKGLNISYLTITVRSMGTASYIAVGRPGYQEERLTAVGDTIEVQASGMSYINTAKIMILADVADAVIEVGGVMLPRGCLLDKS